VIAIKIMFVCLGNICRSPMAEAIFRNMVTQKGLHDKIIAASCGTSGYNIGDPPHSGTKKILASHGISHEGIRASKLERRHLREFDALIAMDEDNLADILRLKDKNATALVKLLSDFSKGGWVSVPDPWYTGNFELTYELITDGCATLLDYIVDTMEREKPGV